MFDDPDVPLVYSEVEKLEDRYMKPGNKMVNEIRRIAAESGHRLTQAVKKEIL